MDTLIDQDAVSPTSDLAVIDTMVTSLSNSHNAPKLQAWLWTLQ